MLTSARASKLKLTLLSIWLWKDIGSQGMVHLDRESAYMRLVGDFVEKKKLPGLDFWGVADKSAVDDEVYRPFIRGLRGMVPGPGAAAQVPEHVDF